MKNKIIFITLILLVNSVSSADFFSFFKKDKESKSVIVSSDLAEKKHQLESLKEEKNNLESSLQESVVSLQSEADKINSKILELESSLKKHDIEDKKFLNEQLNTSRDILQSINDTVFFKKQSLQLLDQQIKLVQEFINNPDFSGLKIETQSYYSFETLELLNQKILNYEENLARLQDEKTTIEAEVESRKKDLTNIEKDLKNAAIQQKQFTTNTKRTSDLDSKQNAEVLDLKIQFLETKKLLSEEKIKESSYKQAVNSLKIFMTRMQLNILKQDLKTVERKLRVYESDVEKDTKKIDILRKETSNTQVNLSNEIKNITEEKQNIEEQLKSEIEKTNIAQATLTSLINWTIDTKNESFSKENSLFKLGYLQDKILADEYKIELIEAKKDYAQNKLLSEEITNKIIQTWHKITQKKLKSEEEIVLLKNEFESLKKDENRTISLYKDKISTATSQINNHAKILNTIKEKIEEIKKREEFYNEQNASKNYNESLEWLKKAESEISNQIDSNSELIKVYSTIIASTRNTQKQVDLLISMLDRIGGSVLYRSEYAISVGSLKSIVPEVKTFISDIKNILKTYISYFKLSNLIKFAKDKFSNIYLLLKLFLLVGLILVLYILLRKFLPFLANKIVGYQTLSKSFNFFSKSIAASFSFASQHLLGLLIWSTLLILIKLEYISQIEHKLMFFVVSIPYMLYISAQLLNYLIKFNREHEYAIISKQFEIRFYYVASFLTYTTIIIFLFKEAFNVTNYGKVELPTILDAAWSIIFRACIIFIIGKEEILSIIPSKPKFWAWVRTLIDSYYYLILAIILVLMITSDPYIGGFGKLVSYILWGTIGTILLIIFLSWIQVFIRKLSLNIFFSSEDDSRKERFPYAKTFYALFIISVFVFFVLFAIYLGSRIWGQPISIESLTKLLNYKLFSVLGDTNEYYPITIGSVLTLVGFIIGGIVTSWLFDKFVLKKIYNALLVDTGIQNTISSISNYLIFILAVFLGLFKINISSTTMSYFIGALAVALAFAIKGPANDFIGYFIILVERSIKIGDFVQFTLPGQLPITGVVRKITPRTIILRRKNSVSLIVPNSIIASNTYYNWSYTNTFLAFDDILITVPYKSDPKKVKELLLKVLDQNPDILKTPKPIIRLHEFSEYGFTFLIRGFISSANVLMQWDIASDVRLAIVEEIRNHDIEIAVPVRIIETQKSGNRQIKDVPNLPID